MSRRAPRQARHRQRGIAAVEVAILVPIILIMLTVPLLLGRVFWHYTVAQKAAHDAARYLSGLPLVEMAAPARIGSALAVAQAIATAEMADLNPGPYAPVVSLQCDGITCSGFAPPSTVRVVVQMPIYDTLFPAFTGELVGPYGWLITADVTMRYVQD